MSNQDIADELHKPIIRKFQRQKVHSSFEDNILGTNLADMQLIVNKGFRFSLRLTGISSKHVFPLKGKIDRTITNAFARI